VHKRREHDNACRISTLVRAAWSLVDTPLIHSYRCARQCMQPWQHFQRESSSKFVCQIHGVCCSWSKALGLKTHENKVVLV
jgi:hypothetical protein